MSADKWESDGRGDDHASAMLRGAEALAYTWVKVGWQQSGRQQYCCIVILLALFTSVGKDGWGMLGNGNQPTSKAVVSATIADMLCGILVQNGTVK